jgi:hypothetical protein
VQAEPYSDPRAQFLSRVVPWSIAGAPETFVNLHGFTPKSNPRTNYRRKGGGRAYAGLAELPALLAFADLLNHDGDEVFFCLSARSDHAGTNRWGNRKASRNSAISKPVWLRSFVLDLDVKPSAYPSQRTALAAALPWLEGLGLKPGPIVSTGIGLHVYIVLDQAIEPSRWQPLANKLIAAAEAAGIKLDTAVTRDDDRILRLPGSWNLKDANNPQPCRLLDLGNETALEDLERILAPVNVFVRSQSTGPSDLDPLTFPRRKPITGPETERVRNEIAQLKVATSVDLLRIACPVVADSETRHGNGDLEPLWFELAKLCHYVEDGRDFFHSLSSGDPRYDHEQADAKYDTVQPQGWPACATIAQASPAAAAICKSCAHYEKGQSPIHPAIRGLPGKIASAVTAATLSLASPAMPVTVDYVNGHPMADSFLPKTWERPIWLPPGYDYTVEGYILVSGTNIRVFNTPVLEIGQTYLADTTTELDFRILRGTEETDDESQFSIGLGSLSSKAKFAEQAMSHGLVPNPLTPKEVMFGMDLLTQIRQSKLAHTQKRQGWVHKDGTRVGFAYGGWTFTKGEKSRLATPDDRFRPCGTLENWKPAANTFVGKDLVEMEIVIAAAFAAPLIEFTIVDGVILFTHSVLSGYGKTGSMAAAASVWYHPKQMLVEAATYNFATSRIAAVNNLPACFNDFIPDDAERWVGRFIKDVTSGAEKGRLTRTSKEITRRFSRTLMIGNGNRSIVEMSGVKDTNAQAVRVLEYEMPHRVTHIARDDAQLRETLEQNFGMAGLVYAEFLGNHHEAVASMVKDTVRDLQRRLGADEGERFWIAAIATLIVGATIARKLDLVQFDLRGIEMFLLNWFNARRAHINELEINADDPVVQQQRVINFLNERVRNRLITDRMPRRGHGQVTMKHPPAPNVNEFVARYAINDRKLWVSEPKLEYWCQQRGYQYLTMKKVLLRNKFCVRHQQGRSLGAGCPADYRTGSEKVLEFDLRDSRNAGFMPELGGEDG